VPNLRLGFFLFFFFGFLKLLAFIIFLGIRRGMKGGEVLTPLRSIREAENFTNLVTDILACAGIFFL